MVVTTYERNFANQNLTGIPFAVSRGKNKAALYIDIHVQHDALHFKFKYLKCVVVRVFIDSLKNYLTKMDHIINFTILWLCFLLHFDKGWPIPC